MLHDVRGAVVGFGKCLEGNGKCFVRIVGLDLDEPGAAFNMLEIETFGIQLFYESFFNQFETMLVSGCCKSHKYWN